MVLFKSIIGSYLARNLGLGVIILLAVWSCNKEYVAQSDNYYPYENDQSRIYEVKEVNYFLNEPKIEKTYYLKEVISNIEKKESQVTLTLQRFKSPTTSNWKLDSVWTATLTPDKLVIKENNIDLLKLTYPIIDNSKWNINYYNTAKPLFAFSTIESKSRFYEKIEVPESVKVTIINDSSLVSLKKHYERYGSNIGLVESSKENFEYCQSTPDCIGKGIISFGQSKKVRLIALETSK